MSIRGQTQTGPATGKVSQVELAGRLDGDTLLKPIAGSRLDVVQVMQSRWTREPVTGFGKFAGDVRGGNAQEWREVIALAEEVLGKGGTGAAIAAGESSRLADRWRGRTAIEFLIEGGVSANEPSSRPSSLTKPITALLESAGQSRDVLRSSALRTPQAWFNWAGHDIDPRDVAGLLYLPDPFVEGDPFAGSFSLRDLIEVHPGRPSDDEASDEEQVKRAILETASGLTSANAAAGPLGGYLFQDLPYPLADLLREMPGVEVRRVRIPASLVPETVELGSLDVASAGRWVRSPPAFGATDGSVGDLPDEGYLLSGEFSIGAVRVLMTAGPVVPIGVFVRKGADDYAGRRLLSDVDDWGAGPRASLHVVLLTQFAHVDGRYLPTQAVSATVRRHEDESTSASVEQWAAASAALSAANTEDDESFFHPDFKDGTLVMRTAAGPALPEEWRDGAPRLTVDALAIEQARINALAAADRAGERPARGWLLPQALVLLVAVGLLCIWWLRRGASTGKGAG